jgi:hypothetical protein
MLARRASDIGLGGYVATAKERWILDPYEAVGWLARTTTLTEATAVFGEEPICHESTNTTRYAFREAGVFLFYRDEVGLSEVVVFRRSPFVVEGLGIVLSGSLSRSIDRLQQAGAAPPENADPVTWIFHDLGFVLFVPDGRKSIEAVCVRLDRGFWDAWERRRSAR